MACELRYGCAKKGSAKLLAQIEAILLDSVPVLVLDAPADAEYGGIRAELEAAGKPIRANDMLMPPMHLPSGRSGKWITIRIRQKNHVQFRSLSALSADNYGFLHPLKSAGLQHILTSSMRPSIGAGAPKTDSAAGRGDLAPRLSFIGGGMIQVFGVRPADRTIAGRLVVCILGFWVAA
ncbi:hypothetical protein RLEG12_05985 (plasmid) [Rhizobium leguminosarum bv. trifolii CB782]|nr:hypothetical protein RLEG12_05985 [Rhizobium leguminosarum bv. trifolii CB782]